MKDNHSDRLQKTLHKRVVTMDDILLRDYVNDVLGDILKKKGKIKDLIVIWTDSEGNYHWSITEGTLTSTTVWTLEGTKLDVMNSNFEEE